MSLRSFRTLFLCLCLLGLVVLSGALSVRATTPARTVGRSFQPSGHGIVKPQKIDTANLPHLKAEIASMNVQHPAPSTHPIVGALQRLPAPRNVVRVPAASSVDPSAKEGISQQSLIKPDATGAGGLDNYLETTDTGLAIYTRSGTQQLLGNYPSWFNVNDSFFDPVTVWDNTGDRFIFSVLPNKAETIMVSVAQQANALGKYCNYSFPTPKGHDFDKLGVDSDGIYFSANVLATGTQNVVGNYLFYASRTSLENCQTASYTDWVNVTNPDGSIAQTIVPARRDSPANGVEYLVNSFPLGGCQLTLWTLTSSGNLSNSSVSTQCYSPPTDAKQKGSSTLISTGDCSITQASYVGGLLTVDTNGSYDWGDGNGPVGIVEWYVINPSSSSISSQGSFGTPGYWLFYPSTITTSNGHMLFMYSASGASIYPSVWYVNQTFKVTTALANGVTSYVTSGGASPWGDYQSAWPDASTKSPNSVWITGEYAKATTTWGTRFDLVTP